MVYPDEQSEEQEYLVFQMANIVALEEILDKIKQNEGISDAVLVSRSGMHIAGNVPKGAHAETFVAMSAILLGAAETATSELKERLRIVSIMLEQSKVAIGVVSQKAVLVLKADLDEADEKLLQILRDNSSKLESAL
jgi:predicted regulator of Ras-like GTPase activity (Roadblock/LC7/MglB family)